ncbi:MAG: acylneuraminate cytidylyltransferase [Gammaproteobacteria bacterium GWF2_41_13]|nr:MAG: acylneuraminate cytidylyltransferase [Gammaproteobacteria bacterium GWF2_41_13]
MKVVAVIPARGGSRRIPHKNIIEFVGKPLIEWTIEAAIASQLFDKIIVSTDDVAIAKVAEECGIEVPFLRQAASDDITPVSMATIEAIKQAQNYWNDEYDVVVQLMANCPTRGSQEIVDSYNHFTQAEVNYQLSCFKFGFMNPWWAARLDESSKPAFIFPESLQMRSQDLPDLYCPTGAIWIARVPNLIKEKTFYGQDHIFYPIGWKEALDIDNREDLELAAIIFKSKLFKV